MDATPSEKFILTAGVRVFFGRRASEDGNRGIQGRADWVYQTFVGVRWVVGTLVVVPVILIVAFVLGKVFRKVGLPSVVGQILAGIFWGFPSLNVCSSVMDPLW